ncbi:hypothetical protein [Escherichia coli]
MSLGVIAGNTLIIKEKYKDTVMNDTCDTMTPISIKYNDHCYIITVVVIFFKNAVIGVIGVISNVATLAGYGLRTMTPTMTPYKLMTPRRHFENKKSPGIRQGNGQQLL